MYSYGSPHTAAQKQDDQHERTFSSYVRIQVVVLKTYLGRWTIGRSGERGSGISVLPARYDDDDDYQHHYHHHHHCFVLTGITTDFKLLFLFLIIIPSSIKKLHLKCCSLFLKVKKNLGYIFLCITSKICPLLKWTLVNTKKSYNISLFNNCVFLIIPLLPEF